MPTRFQCNYRRPVVRFFCLLALVSPTADLCLSSALAAAEPIEQSGEADGIPQGLHARGLFFEGSIELNAWVVPAGSREGPGGGKGASRAERGGGGGGSGASMGRGPGGNPGGGGKRGGGSRPNIRAQNTASKSLGLELTNHGTETAVIEVIDFKSKFGNFAVQPDSITIPPGETVRAEPMLSRLEVYDDVIPLELRLIRGETSEEQTLTFGWEQQPVEPSSTNEQELAAP